MSVPVRTGIDAWVDSTTPSLNAGAGIYTRFVSAGSVNRRVGLLHMKMPTPVMRGATVLSATLRLYEGLFAPGGTRDVTVQRLAQGWSESKVNWNNRPPGADRGRVRRGPGGRVGRREQCGGGAAARVRPASG